MIYLDAAATTLEKPPQVRQAMAQAAAELSTPGRGSHPAARRAEETAFRCRAEAAALFGVPSPENVVFTMNATHGLNIAIRSLVVPGSRVVISGYEHNAVCRPLYAIPEVRLTVVDAPPFRREQAASTMYPTCSAASSRWRRSPESAAAGVCRCWWTPPNRQGRCPCT